MRKGFSVGFAALFTLSAAAAMAADDYSAVGIVNAIKVKEKKLNITHEPVKGLMEGMTMDFPVLDPAMLDEVSIGSKIKFVLVKDRSGILMITDLETLRSTTATK